MAKRPAEKEAEPPKPATNFRENVGRLLLDIGKILFGTLFLGGVLRGEVEPLVTVIAGIGTAMLFFVFGIWLTTKKKDKG
jgi:hypothetical protein